MERYGCCAAGSNSPSRNCESRAAHATRFTTARHGTAHRNGGRGQRCTHLHREEVRQRCIDGVHGHRGVVQRRLQVQQHVRTAVDVLHGTRRTTAASGNDTVRRSMSTTMR
jgi:hypothetical protein